MSERPENCPSCGRHSSWGCAFSCPDRQAPREYAQYRVWADEQKLHYARGERPGDEAPRNTKETR